MTIHICFWKSKTSLKKWQDQSKRNTSDCLRFKMNCWLVISADDRLPIINCFSLYSPWELMTFSGEIFRRFSKENPFYSAGCGARRIFCQHNMWILFLAQSDWWTSKLGKKTQYVYKHRKLIIFNLTKFGKLQKSVLFYCKK